MTETKGFLDLLDKLNDDEINQIYEFARNQKLKTLKIANDKLNDRLRYITTRPRVRELLVDVAREIGEKNEM